MLIQILSLSRSLLLKVNIKHKFAKYQCCQYSEKIKIVLGHEQTILLLRPKDIIPEHLIYITMKEISRCCRMNFRQMQIKYFLVIQKDKCL